MAPPPASKIIAVHLNYREPRGSSAAARRRARRTSSSRRPRSPATATRSSARGAPSCSPSRARSRSSSARARATSRPSDGLAHDRLVRARQRLRRLRPALGRPRLERAGQGPRRLHAARRRWSPPRDVDPDGARPAHARQRRGRAGGLDGRTCSSASACSSPTSRAS